MKRISVKDASVLSFVVHHRNASKSQVDSVLAKAEPSLRFALRNARNASKGGKTKAKSLGSKTGQVVRSQIEESDDTLKGNYTFNSLGE
jgi:hypothetical protein